MSSYKYFSIKIFNDSSYLSILKIILKKYIPGVYLNGATGVTSFTNTDNDRKGLAYIFQTFNSNTNAFVQVGLYDPTAANQVTFDSTFQASLPNGNIPG